MNPNPFSSNQFFTVPVVLPPEDGIPLDCNPVDGIPFDCIGIAIWAPDPYSIWASDPYGI